MRRIQISTVLLLGTLTALLTGCSRNPVAPTINVPMNGDAGSMAGAQSDDTPSTIEGGQPAAATTSLAINQEGRLTVGRFTLELHKNSLKMPATISLRVSSPDAMEVEIEVTPAEANDFRVPVSLTANLSDQPATNWDAVTMFSWENSAWEPCADTTPQIGPQNVVARVKHLSAMRVGDEVAAAESEQTR